MIEVRRMPRNTAAGFERVPNAAIRNVELSLSAVGLLARLLADGEQYDSIDDIAAAFNPAKPGEKTPYGFGRDVYRKAALELEAAGHLVRTEEKGAGSRTRSLARAIPEKAQVVPATDSPSRERRGKTGIGAAQAQDGQSVAGTTWENDAYEHVEPRTDSPSRHSPAETALSARQSHDGQSVADYIQTSSQTTDLLLHDSDQVGDKQEEVDADAFEPHPDAHAVIAAVDLGGMSLVGKPYGEVIRILSQKLNEGWTPTTLEPKFKGCTINALNPPGVFAARVRALGAPPKPRARDSPALDPWCHKCGDNNPICETSARFRTLDGTVTGEICPTCHPNRKARP